MKYTIVPFIHGVQLGELDKETVRGLIQKTRAHLPDWVRDYVIFPIIDWGEVVAQRQLEAFEMEAGLPDQGLLKIKHTLFSDIFWDVMTEEKLGDPSITAEVIAMLRNSIDTAVQRYGEDSNIVLVGHSYGGQRALSFCFDSKYTVQGLVTMGAPITLRSGRFRDWGKLPPKLKFWLNFRARHDVIGSQFSHHKNPTFRAFVEDVHLDSWNPLMFLKVKAHCSYWTRDDVAEKLANVIVKNLYSPR